MRLRDRERHRDERKQQRPTFVEEIWNVQRNAGDIGVDDTEQLQQGRRRVINDAANRNDISQADHGLASARNGLNAYSPLATVIIGGLWVSTVLTLFVVPVLHDAFDEFGVWWRARQPKSPTKGIATTQVTARD